MKRQFIAFTASIALCAGVGVAGIRAPGKCSGVVVFDRWGGCMLCSGIYVMYISKGGKERLRAQQGQCVQLDATEVDQPMNPGDGLIKQFRLLGPAPAAREWESAEGLKIAAVRAFDDGHPPEIIIRVENAGDKPRTLRMESLAPTLLAAKEKGGFRWDPSDGPSSAVVTRQSFWIGQEGPRMHGNETWQWDVVSPQKLDKEVALDPRAAFEIRLAFKLPPGEYEFLAGYGGGVQEGQCIASNLIGFDVRKDGTAAGTKAAPR